MLDKRRNRRMNAVLLGLGDTGDDYTGFDTPPPDDSNPFGSTVADIPTVQDQPGTSVQVPSTSGGSNWLDLLNKGAQAAVTVLASQKKATTTTGTAKSGINSTTLIIAAVAAYLLLG